MSGQQKEYITQTLNPFLKEIITAVLLKTPEDPVPFMVDWLSNKLGVPSKKSDKEELRLLRQEVTRLKTAKKPSAEGELNENSEEEEADS